MRGQEDSSPSQPDIDDDVDLGGPIGRASVKVHCTHEKTRTDKTHSGNFLVLRTVCESCGRIVNEENILLGLEHSRCPVDPRLDRCLLSCPVEDGSVGVFENPCEPVRNAMETVGFMAIAPSPPERESPEK